MSNTKTAKHANTTSIFHTWCDFMLVDGIAHIAGLSWWGPSWIQTIWRCSKGLHFKIHTWNNEDLVSPISYVSSSFFMPNKWFFFVTPVDYGHVAWWGMAKNLSMTHDHVSHPKPHVWYIFLRAMPKADIFSMIQFLTWCRKHANRFSDVSAFSDFIL